MVGPRAETLVLYMVAALAWVAAVAAAAASTSVVAAAEQITAKMAMELVTNIGDINDNDMRDDRRPIVTKQLIVVEPQQQPRRFRHEASAVRVLYQTGVSIFMYNTVIRGLCARGRVRIPFCVILCYVLLPYDLSCSLDFRSIGKTVQNMLNYRVLPKKRNPNSARLCFGVQFKHHWCTKKFASIIYIRVYLCI